MVNVKADNGHIEISIKGNIPMLTADTSLIVYSVYKSIKKSDAAMAELFKGYFCERCSEIFNLDDEDVSVKKEPKHSSNDMMDMLINHLDELSAILKAEKARKEDK